MNLYELSREFENCIDPETGEIDTQKFEDLRLTFNQKSENLIKYIKNLAANVEALSTEEKKLAERRKSIENIITNKTNYLKDVMLVKGVSKMEYTAGIAKFGKSTAVEVDNDFVEWAKKNKFENLIRVTVTEEPNKKAISKAIDGGQKIEHAKVVERQNLQIK